MCNSNSKQTTTVGGTNTLCALTLMADALRRRIYPVVSAVLSAALALCRSARVFGVVSLDATACDVRVESDRDFCNTVVVRSARNTCWRHEDILIAFRRLPVFIQAAWSITSSNLLPVDVYLTVNLGGGWASPGMS